MSVTVGTRTDGSYGRTKSDAVAPTDLDTQYQSSNFNNIADALITVETDHNAVETAKVAGPASNATNAIPQWDGTTGKIIKDTSTLVYSSGELRNTSTTAANRIRERAAGPTGIAGHGHVWVQNNVPSSAMFTDDADNDHRLSPSVGNTVAPGTGDDGASGFPVGSIWIDETADDAYISLDSTTATAVWKIIT